MRPACPPRLPPALSPVRLGRHDQIDLLPVDQLGHRLGGDIDRALAVAQQDFHRVALAAHLQSAGEDLVELGFHKRHGFTEQRTGP